MYRKAFSFFTLFLLAMGGGIGARMLVDPNLSSAGPAAGVQDFLYEKVGLRGQETFIEAANTASTGGKNFNDIKARYIQEKQKFAVADLHAMTVEVYDNGEKLFSVPILTKGREGSWWETPSGNYSVLSKEANHFSSIGKVWMPWSIQFYGNFFIHGWPYHEGGEPVPQSYTGGCIRLSTEDAKKVFDALSMGSPILVSDDSSVIDVGIAPLRGGDGAVPEISAKAAIVVDMNNDAILLNKNGDTQLPVASLTKLMTAVVASELVYLERSITITPSMLTAKIQSYPLQAGERYVAFDLMYPLLMDSSNGAASALAAFLGEKNFVGNMNGKAKSLSMADTHFADPSGISDENLSTAKDLTRLVYYILEKRHFIFDITKGKPYLNFGPLNITTPKNFNEFAARENLIGMKNGETEAAQQTITSAWNLSSPKEGGEKINSHVIAIVVLGTPDRVGDTEKILQWLSVSYNLQ